MMSIKNRLYSTIWPQSSSVKTSQYIPIREIALERENIFLNTTYEHDTNID